MYLGIFAERLKDLMELEGTSIRALSIKLNVDRKSIRHWLQAKHFPRYDAFVKLAVYYQVSLDYLVGLDDGFLCSPNLFTDEGALERIRVDFLENLSSYMHAHKLTRYALSKELQIAQKPITNWLTKGSMPEVGTLIKLAQLMNCSLATLLSHG